MPLSLLNHSALALLAQRTRIPTSARSIVFCVIWVCISSSSKRFELHIVKFLIRVESFVKLANASERLRRRLRNHELHTQ